MVKLRKYQQDAVKAIDQNAKGIISAATGSGKTTIMAAAIQKQQGSVLILVHTRALVNQTVSRLQSETNRRVGAFYGEDKTGLGQEILVATWQSMIRLNGLLQFNHIHVDECHNARGQKYGKLIQSIKCDTLHGYTATLHGPGEDAVKAIFGEVIFEIGMFELIQQGYLSKMKVLINVGPVGSRKYNESKFDIIREQTKENGTVQKALHFYSRNKRFQEVREWNLLPKNSFYEVSASVSRDKREIVFQTFRKQNSGLNHLLTNRVLNEGIDLPITNTLVFHECVGDFRTVSQRFGRGLRVYEGNNTDTTIIMLFVDETKRNQLHSVEELINQVEYESKKHGKSAIKSVKGKSYHKHDNDPTDDIPVTISLIDKTAEVMRTFAGSKHMKADDYTLEDFISQMRKDNIISISQYRNVWRNYNFGSHPQNKLNMTAAQLWKEVRGEEDYTLEDFVAKMKKDGITSGTQYRNVWRNYNFGSTPDCKLNMTAAQLWKEVRRGEGYTLEDFVAQMRKDGITSGAQYFTVYKSYNFGSNPHYKLNMTIGQLWKEVRGE